MSPTSVTYSFMTDINDIIQHLGYSEREPKGLYAPISYALSAGGKRLRPRLAILGAQLFEGREAAGEQLESRVMPAALSLEIFHNFTLLHDDVMDNAEVRRGRPCVHKQWDVNTAILSGDQMLIEAYTLLSQVESHRLGEVLHLFNTMATGVCEGQQLDVDFENRDDVTLNDYLKMIGGKTAILLATALRIGALLAGANEQEQLTLYEIGYHLGIAFQIEDDLLDCYGDEKTFGKAIGGDIREGKKTYLLLTANERNGRPLQTRGRSLDEVLSDYDRLGVKQATTKAIADETESARRLLLTLPVTNAREQLMSLADKLAQRTI